MLWTSVKNTLNHVLDILHETDEEGTIREIYDKIPIRGNNTWMLICSVVLASIGLDTSSGAVIIGAMLVSPLMSPILGIGLSVGINDREMLVASAKNLGLAALAGLFFSTLYFSITPLGEPTNEIIARTQPTLLDVMVAFFGGVAGIISISRSDKSNALPGVAIATALMPPLCTAGYGLAMGNLSFFFGAFYLFFINAVFISLATFLIVKYLKFESKHYLNKQIERRVARIMAVMIFIVVMPSIYFLYNVYTKVQTKKMIEQLIVKDFAGRDNEIIKWEVMESDSVDVIKIYSVGNTVEDNLVEHYHKVLRENGLKSYRVKLVQLDVSAEDVRQMASDITNNLTQDMLKTFELQKLQTQRADSLRRRQQAVTYTSRQATIDLKLLFPEIRNVQVGEMISTASMTRQDTVMLVRLNWLPPQTATTRSVKLEPARIKEYEDRISVYLANKLRRDTVLVESTY